METELGEQAAFGVGTDNYHITGLTKREYMAIEFTKACLSRGDTTERSVELGLKATEKLLEALNN